MKRSFKCSEAELYAISYLFWQAVVADLADFVAYKLKYVLSFIQDKVTQTDTAKALPDAVARYAPTKNLREDLSFINADIVDMFDSLMGYIDDAYTTDEKIKTMKQTAGLPYYTKAKSYNWVSTTALISSATDFLVKYKDDLSINNMPPAFVQDFLTKAEKFNAVFKTWQASDATSFSLTNEKGVANNDVSDSLKAGLVDAQKVYRKNPEKASQYTFEFFLAQVRGTKAAGAAGKITIDGTKTAIENAKISVATLGLSVSSDAEGRFDLSPVASGFYDVTIEAEGYETIVLAQYEVKVGTIGRLNVEMKKN